MESLRWIGGVLLLTLEASLSGCAARPGGGEAPLSAAEVRGVVFRSVDAGRRSNRYAVYIPRDLDLSVPAPVIVFLHGRGECGTEGSRHLTVGLPTAVLANPEHWPFIVIFPQKPAGGDTWEQHVELVLACLSGTSREWRLDQQRIYLSGLSQGGAGTWAIGARHPELFAAIAPVCGFVHDPRGEVSGKVTVGDEKQHRDVAGRLAAAKMPIWAFHGERDDVVLPGETRRLIAAIEEAGGTARATYLPEANHNAWDEAYRTQGRALSDWLLAHRR
jgi:predicted peptidase